MTGFAKISNRVGLAPRLLLPTCVGVVLAMLLVQAWIWARMGTLEQTRNLQQLQISLNLLKAELAPLGSEWALADGQLTLGGHPLAGRSDLVDAVKDVSGAVATVFRGDTRVVTNVQRPDGSRAVGTQLAAGPAYQAVLREGHSFTGAANVLGRPHLVIYEPVRDAAGHQVGVLFVGVPTTASAVELNRLGWEALAGAGIATLLLSLGLWAWVGINMRSVTALARAMRQIAGGALETVVPGTDRTDQLGDMARALGELANISAGARSAEAEAAALRLRTEQQRAAIAQQTAAAFEDSLGDVLGRLAATAEDLREANDSLGVTAGDATQQVAGTAAGAGEASRNVQAVAAATEQMSASIAEITRQVTQAAGAARRALDQVRQTDSSVRGLADSASRIGDVVQLISRIAGQTNLLALNATIEAARAGPAGKGFAVVASEVKALAAQTAGATEDIGRQIAAIQASTQGAVEAITGIGGVVAEVDQIAVAIATAVEQQGQTTREIARRIADAAAGTEEVSASATRLNNAMDQTGSALHRLTSATQDVSREGDILRSAAQGFLARLRAA